MSLNIFLLLQKAHRSILFSVDQDDLSKPSGKKDIRHAYAKLFEDGFNSSDPDGFRDILTKMFADHTVLESYRLDNISGKGKEILENATDGTENLIQYFVGYVVSIPDLVFLVHEWKLFPRSSNQSCLVFKFSLTGTQTYEFECPCTAEDHTNGYVREASKCEDDKDGSNKKRSTVTFRETGRNTKYESRKRNKIYTIGEYVDANQLNPSYMESTEESINPTEEDSRQAIVGPAVVDLSGVETKPRSDTNVVRRTETRKINMVGVMRFHINADLKVWKIHCVHIHEH